MFGKVWYVGHVAQGILVGKGRGASVVVCTTFGKFKEFKVFLGGESLAAEAEAAFVLVGVVDI